MKALPGQYERLQLHVSASNREVIRKAHKRLSKEGKSRAFRSERHEWLRSLVEEHREARELYGYVMRGF